MSTRIVSAGSLLQAALRGQARAAVPVARLVEHPLTARGVVHCDELLTDALLMWTAARVETEGLWAEWGELEEIILRDESPGTDRA